jgi:glycosyltransferase involved in cell wall biosynthesis
VAALSPQLQDRVRVTRLAHADMPRALSAADIGLALRTPAPSQAAVSPLKVGEYLCSGLPVLTNSTVGDLGTIFEGHDAAGLVLSSLSPASLEDGADWAVRVTGQQAETGRREARRLGEAEFSLAKAAAGYERIYADALGYGGGRLSHVSAASRRASAIARADCSMV